MWTNFACSHVVLRAYTHIVKWPYYVPHDYTQIACECSYISHKQHGTAFQYTYTVHWLGLSTRLIAPWYTDDSDPARKRVPLPKAGGRLAPGSEAQRPSQKNHRCDAVHSARSHKFADVSINKKKQSKWSQYGRSDEVTSAIKTDLDNAKRMVICFHKRIPA